MNGCHVNGHGNERHRIYKVVLTGGPCGGKTTGQDRLASFFESMGWKVFRVPETSTILLGGGVKFAELDEESAYTFQQDLLRTMLQIENVFVNLAEKCSRDCIIIFDRGAMDPSAYMSPEEWHKMLEANDLNEIDIRDNRYHQVVHMMTAAKGAEKFYTQSNNNTRSEGMELARQIDSQTKKAWIGHPYVDIVDNDGCKSFEDKILRMIQVICDRANINVGDRLAKNAKKRKFLVSHVDEARFPPATRFKVVHDYLLTTPHTAVAHDPTGGTTSPHAEVQIRIRKRGQGKNWSYTHTTRRTVNGKTVETRMQLSARDYELMRQLVDPSRSTTFKQRRCFTTDNNFYFQLDVYSEPGPPACRGLVILETYTTDTGPITMPDFIHVLKEVTGDPQYSLFNLSRVG